MAIAFLLILLFFVTFWALTNLALFVYALAGAWLVIGLLWAPFAGLILVKTSPNRALFSENSRARRFCIGAATSALFLLPWVYLLLQYKCKHRADARPVRIVYYALYAIWVAGALQQSLLFTAMAFGFWLLDNSGPPHDPIVYGAFVQLPLTPLHLWAFVWSLKRLRRRWREDVEVTHLDQAGALTVDFASPAYLMPFLWVYGWTVFGILHYWFFQIPGLCDIDFPTKVYPVC